jgi:hypothetical protein
MSNSVAETTSKRARWLADMDPGIAPYVNILDAHGIETYESCQAGEGHCYPEPAVRFHGQVGEGYRAVQIALTYGMPVTDLRRFWTINRHGELDGPTWEIVFSRPAKEGELGDIAGMVPVMEMFVRSFQKRIEASRPTDGRSA